jgi:hypothetical protein
MLELHLKFHAPAMFPDPDDPRNLKTLVAEENGVPVAFVVIRPTVELFGIGDQAAGDPYKRLDRISELIAAAGREAAVFGVGEAHLPVPSEMKRYGDRLEQAGLAKDPRTHYILDVAAFARSERITACP